MSASVARKPFRRGVGEDKNNNNKNKFDSTMKQIERLMLELHDKSAHQVRNALKKELHKLVIDRLHCSSISDVCRLVTEDVMMSTTTSTRFWSNNQHSAERLLVLTQQYLPIDGVTLDEKTTWDAIYSKIATHNKPTRSRLHPITPTPPESAKKSNHNNNSINNNNTNNNVDSIDHITFPKFVDETKWIDFREHVRTICGRAKCRSFFTSPDRGSEEPEKSRTLWVALKDALDDGPAKEIPLLSQDSQDPFALWSALLDEYDLDSKAPPAATATATAAGSRKRHAVQQEQRTPRYAKLQKTTVDDQEEASDEEMSDDDEIPPPPPPPVSNKTKTLKEDDGKKPRALALSLQQIRQARATAPHVPTPPLCSSDAESTSDEEEESFIMEPKDKCATTRIGKRSTVLGGDNDEDDDDCEDPFQEETSYWGNPAESSSRSRSNRRSTTEEEDEHDPMVASVHSRSSSHAERATFVSTATPYTSRSACSGFLSAREEDSDEEEEDELTDGDDDEEEEEENSEDCELDGLEHEDDAPNDDHHDDRSRLVLSSSNNPHEPSFVSGDLVNIVKGVHKGKTAIFVSQTEQRVGLRFPGDEPNHVRHFALSSVKLSSARSRPSRRSPAKNGLSRGGGRGGGGGGGEQARTHSLSTQNAELTTVSNCVTSSNSSTEGTPIVNIIAGTHKGKSAYLIKHTAKGVGVRLLDDDPATVRYLAHKNVRDSPPTPVSVASANHSEQSSVASANHSEQSSVASANHSEQSSVASASHPEQQQQQQQQQQHQHQHQQLQLSSSRATAGTRYAPETSVARSHPNINTFLNMPIQCIYLQAPGEVLPLHSTFAAVIFGQRLVEVRIRATANVGELPRHFVHPNDGCKYDLLVTKLQFKAVRVAGMSFSSMYISAIYILVSGPGVSTLNLKSELNTIAAFGELKPTKAAARLELLCSTSRRSSQKDRDFLIFDDLTSDDFDLIPEGANEGCGFCPARFIKRWLGKHAVGKRTFALQVRVFGSKIGIAKGLLMAKPGINKIQLPPSMIKVGRTHRDANDKVLVLVTTNGIFPFPAHCYTHRIMSGEEAPPKSFRPKALSNMILCLFKSLGVPSTLVDNYAIESREGHGKRLKHANLIGLADPTDCLPSGHVFITGIKGSKEFAKDLFVTRYPCTESGDGNMLPIVHKKPQGMLKSDWAWLQSLSFGGIIFANPSPGQPPLPNMIADGDLDGDLYFVCWHKRMLSHIRKNDHGPHPPSNAQLSRNDQIEAQAVPSWNENWLEDAQDLMRSVGSLVDKHKLISALFKAMESAEDEPTATAFSRAYKEAIRIGKHGGSVKLSSRYWDVIDEHFHRYLCDE